VTNQLVQVCRDYVEDGLTGPASGGQLWQQMWQEVVNRKDDSTTGGQHKTQPNIIIDKMKVWTRHSDIQLQLSYKKEIFQDFSYFTKFGRLINCG